VCGDKIEEVVRVPDNAQMYECEVPGCHKFFINQTKLSIHFQSHGPILPIQMDQQ
jgi:hypothetical protein